MKPLDILLILVSILFATGVIVDYKWGPERRQHHAVVRFQKDRLDVIAKLLTQYHEKTGTWPSTDAGLEVVPGLRKALLAEEFAPAVPFLEKSRGIRTIHGIPYVYENRTDAEKGSYRSSPANKDSRKKRRFSRKIDDGIFVSSLGLRAEMSGFLGSAWLDALLLFSGGVILFLAIAYVFARNRRSGDRVRGINAMLMVGVAVVLTIVVALSTGGRLSSVSGAEVPELLGGYRTDLLQDYLTLMRGYVQAGVLEQATYDRIEKTLTEEFQEGGALGSSTTDTPNEPALPGSDH